MNREKTLAYILAAFILIACLVALTSCSQKTIQSETVTKDSTVIRYKPREIKTFTPSVTVNVRKLIECDPRTNKAKPMAVEKKKNGAKLKAVIDSAGTLDVTGGCDSLEQKLTVMDKEIFRLRHQDKKKTEIVTVYQTRGIDKFCRWFTIIVIIIIIVWIYRKFSGGFTTGIVKFIKGIFSAAR